VAYSKIKKQGVDASDMRGWSRSSCTQAFIDEIHIHKGLAFKALLKDGEKNHCENAEKFKAYEKVLSLIEEAGRLK